MAPLRQPARLVLRQDDTVAFAPSGLRPPCLCARRTALSYKPISLFNYTINGSALKCLFNQL